mgnify:CR=1 FL=1
MSYNYVGVAALTPQVQVANPHENFWIHLKHADQAADMGAQIIVFPELSLTGYTCADLFQQQTLLRKTRQAYKSLLIEVKKTSCKSILVVGMPLVIDNQLFNVAMVSQGDELLGIIPKSYLPNYQHHYEPRWFAPASRLQTKEVQLFGKTVPVGNDLVFSVQTANDKTFTFGVEICEDLWVPNPPSTNHALSGAQILLNLSASTSQVGKAEYRIKLVEHQSAKCFAAYVYCSSGPWESSQDLVFDGHNIIAENGKLITQSDRFSFIAQHTYADIDIDKLDRERMMSGSYSQSIANINPCRHIHVQSELESVAPGATISQPQIYVNPHPFVPSNESVRAQVCEEVFAHMTTGLRRRLAPMKSILNRKVYIGVSGGLDSTLALLTAVRTYDALGWDRKDIVGVTMPGPGSTDRTRKNAIELIKALDITMKVISITEVVTEHLIDIGHSPCWDCVKCENAQARERTQILMDLGFVIGTGDLSEIATGWCTYNGDHMSMYNVNCGVPKTLVKYVVRWVAESRVIDNASKILLDIVDTPISPELTKSETGKVEQKTEDIIGPDELIDFFLYHMVRHGEEPKKILMLATIGFEGKYDEATLKKWLRKFYKRFGASQFKRDAVPNGPKIGSVALSPRGDWRMPSDISLQAWIEEI